jgi:hypothetical protein
VASYNKARAVSKLFVESNLFSVIFCFNDADMLKGIRRFAPNGLPDLLHRDFSASQILKPEINSGF